MSLRAPKPAAVRANKARHRANLRIVFKGDDEHDNAPRTARAGAPATLPGAPDSELEEFVSDFARERNPLRAPRKRPAKQTSNVATTIKAKLMPGESLRDFNHRVDVEARLVLSGKAKAAKSEKKQRRRVDQEAKREARKVKVDKERDGEERPSAQPHPLWDRVEAPPPIDLKNRTRFKELGGDLSGLAARARAAYESKSARV